MSKAVGYTIRLGVFVVLGGLFFIIGIYYIGKKQRLFSDVFKVHGIFNNVSGLQIGNNVRFSGINVGTVDNIIIINDTSVMVDMVIDSHTRKFIKQDAKAFIGSEGLMGNKIINITHGSPSLPAIENNGVVSTGKPLDTDEIFNSLKRTADNAERITGDLASIMNNISRGKGTVGRLFMDSTLANTLNQTVVNLKRGTKGFEENMDAAKSSFLLRGIFKRKNKDADKKGKEKNDSYKKKGKKELEDGDKKETRKERRKRRKEEKLNQEQLKQSQIGSR
jgi:phospholipid/cholesterol/gamma-HCH transport system substrate-binding protein